jgi:hypothetical protein
MGTGNNPFRRVGPPRPADFRLRLSVDQTDARYRTEAVSSVTNKFMPFLTSRQLRSSFDNIDADDATMTVAR